MSRRKPPKPEQTSGRTTVEFISAPTRDEESGGSNPYEHAMYAPPFREKMPDGTLGPEYLPLSYKTGKPVSQAAAYREYRESRDSVPVRTLGTKGGLWDHAEHCPTLSRRLARERQRRINMAAEQQRIERYIAMAHVSTRLAEVAMLYWRHGLSVAQLARQIGVKRETAWRYIFELRRLVRAITPT